MELGTTEGVKPQNKQLEDELLTFYEKEFSPLLKGKPKHSLKNKTYVTPYLAQQIQTSFYNNLKEHFITRVRRFMNIVKPEGAGEKDDTTFTLVKNSILRGNHP